MLVVETIAKIRRAHFQLGHPIKRICRDLRVSRNTVRKVIRSGATEFSYDRTTQPRPKIGLWQIDLDAMLAGNGRRAKRECLTLIRIYEELPMTADMMQFAGMRPSGRRRHGKLLPTPMSR